MERTLIEKKTLRDYQIEAKRQILEAWKTTPNLMLQMPTGTGKTVLFASIINELLSKGNKKRILVVAHRDELIDQASAHLDKYKIEHGIIKGGTRKIDSSFSVYVGSILTVTSISREEAIKALAFDYIVIDEAHHSLANSYKKLWGYFPDSKKLGVTATPCRLDGQGFTELYDKLLLSWPVKQFIEKKYLSDFDFYSISRSSIESQAIASIKKITAGDYNVGEMYDKMSNERIRARLFESYAKFAYGKKGIVYAINIAHSNQICEEYRSHGIKAESIDANTPLAERRELLDKFREGDIQVLVNVDIFSEGFDCPDIEFIQLARPTKSLSLYFQQVGRGLRISKGKDKCIILDNVGMYATFDLPDNPQPWNLYFGGQKYDYKKRAQIMECPDILALKEQDGNDTLTLIYKRDEEIKHNVYINRIKSHWALQYYTLPKENDPNYYFQEIIVKPNFSWSLQKKEASRIKALAKEGLRDIFMLIDKGMRYNHIANGEIMLRHPGLEETGGIIEGDTSIISTKFKNTYYAVAQVLEDLSSEGIARYRCLLSIKTSPEELLRNKVTGDISYPNITYVRKVGIYFNTTKLHLGDPYFSEFETYHKRLLNNLNKYTSLFLSSDKPFPKLTLKITTPTWVIGYFNLCYLPKTYGSRNIEIELAGKDDKGFINVIVKKVDDILPLCKFKADGLKELIVIGADGQKHIFNYIETIEEAEQDPLPSRFEWISGIHVTPIERRTPSPKAEEIIRQLREKQRQRAQVENPIKEPSLIIRFFGNIKVAIAGAIPLILHALYRGASASSSWKPTLIIGDSVLIIVTLFWLLITLLPWVMLYLECQKKVDRYNILSKRTTIH